MSASDKKKLRKQEVIAARTERQRKEQAEAKKLKIYSIVFVASLILIAAIAISVIAVNAYKQSGIAQRNTIAATVGNHKINTVQFNYYYKDAIDNYYSNVSNQFSSSGYMDLYLEAIGLDFSKPLNKQIENEETGATWADYFLEAALANAKNDYVLADLAKKEGFKLPQEDRDVLNSTMESLDSIAKAYEYPNTSDYLEAWYGIGSSRKSYKSYAERQALAAAYKQAHLDSLVYEDADLREYEKDKAQNYNSYDYSYAYLSYTDFRQGGTKDENGNTTYTDAENQAAREAAEFAAKMLETCTTLEELNEMIKLFDPEIEEDEHDHAEDADAADTAEDEASAETEPAEDADKAPETDEAKEKIEGLVTINSSSQLAVNNFTGTLHTEINSTLADWLGQEGRQEGDIEAIPSYATDEDGNNTEDVNGWYVAYFKSKNENNEPLGNVRHLLVAFEGGTIDEETKETVYSDEEKAAAKEKADAYLKTWREGAANEESFIALVKEHTDDTASVETGGLYEDIHPASNYVPNFLSWSIDPDRKAGDSDVIETKHGYHVMYYVGDDELTYRDYMITEEKRTADQEAWYNSALDAVTAKLKNTSLMKLNLVLIKE